MGRFPGDNPKALMYFQDMSEQVVFSLDSFIHLCWSRTSLFPVRETTPYVRHLKKQRNGMEWINLYIKACATPCQCSTFHTTNWDFDCTVCRCKGLVFCAVNETC